MNVWVIQHWELQKVLEFMQTAKKAIFKSQSAGIVRS